MVHKTLRLFIPIPNKNIILVRMDDHVVGVGEHSGRYSLLQDTLIDLFTPYKFKENSSEVCGECPSHGSSKDGSSKGNLWEDAVSDHSSQLAQTCRRHCRLDGLKDQPHISLSCGSFYL